MKIYCSNQFDPGPVKRFIGKDYWFHIDSDLDPRPCWVKLFDLRGNTYLGTYIADSSLRAFLYDYNNDPEGRRERAEDYADSLCLPFIFDKYQPIFEAAIQRGEVLTTEELFQLAEEQPFLYM